MNEFISLQSLVRGDSYLAGLPRRLYYRTQPRGIKGAGGEDSVVHI